VKREPQEPLKPQEPQEPQELQEPRRAPALDGAVEWLNVAAPLSLSQLRGKVVLLDFWT
jgi:hypothetical protein